jgi:hypothetical protein
VRYCASALPYLLVALLAACPLHAQESEKSCRPADLSRLSGWSGIWIAEHLQSEINGREPEGVPPWPDYAMKLVGLAAPWNDAGWARMAAAIRIGVAGTQVQSGWGYPMMMSSPAPFQIVISPDQTVITSQYREIRYIYTDGRSHPPEDERWPTNWGDSIGCWEGDTLVIDTVSVAYSPEFNYFAPPLSDQARFVERMRLTAPDRLESDVTITDPQYLEAPWHVHMVYVRHPVLRRLVHEGDMSTYDRLVVENGTTRIVQASQKLSFGADVPKTVKLGPAELDRVVGRYALEGAPMPATLVVERRGDRLFFQAPPVQLISLPLLAEGPLRFAPLPGGQLRFITDARGTVTGFEGTAPNGQPVNGRRVTGAAERQVRGSQDAR